MSHPALEEGDTAVILDLVERLTVVKSVAQYARAAMVGIRGLVPCIDASYHVLNPSAARVEWTAEPENSPMCEFASVFGRLMRQNPLIRHFEATDDTQARMWSDFAALNEIRRTELWQWQEIYRPLGVHSQMVMVLPAVPGIVVGFEQGAEGGAEGEGGNGGSVSPRNSELPASVADDFAVGFPRVGRKMSSVISD